MGILEKRVVFLPLLGLLAVGLVFIVILLIRAGFDDSDWTFEETLPKMIDEFGEDARVLSVAVGGSSVFYEVIEPGGTLRSREYRLVCTQDCGGGDSNPLNKRRIDDSERSPTPDEIQAAKVTLGEFDAGVVDRMRDEVGLSGSVRAKLAGDKWTLNEHEAEEYVANFDGSGLVRTQTEDEAAGRAGPDPKKLAECVASAGQDPAALLNCTSQ